MEHIEFIDHDHFEYQYHRRYAAGKLSQYIDFCWETDFDKLFADHPDGFTDVLFPNIGYTYLVNLGTPFQMQVDGIKYNVKSDGFLPRHHYIKCDHSAGNQLFGIKFKVCPVLFQKEVDFSEYRERIFPLAYLIDRSVVVAVKNAETFKQRVAIVFDHYSELVEEYENSLRYITIVTSAIKDCTERRQFNVSIDELAARHQVSKRTLQRYFEVTTGFSTKPALQTIRMRQAIKDLAEHPSTFDYTRYGYFDYSHFSKHLRQFTGDEFLKVFQQFYTNRKAENGQPRSAQPQ